MTTEKRNWLKIRCVRVAQQARMHPQCCRVARAYLDRVLMCALAAGDLALAAFVNDQYQITVPWAGGEVA